MLLRAIIRYFRDKYATDPPLDQQERERPMLKLAITASTGIASVNIDGCTLHSWAGIGLGKEDPRVLAKRFISIYSRTRARENEAHVPDSEKLVTALERWQKVRTLIIDESKYNIHNDIATMLTTCTFPVSMIDAILFDKLVCP